MQSGLVCVQGGTTVHTIDCMQDTHFSGSTMFVGCNISIGEGILQGDPETVDRVR